MFGCCGCEQEKFKTVDSAVDQQRVEALASGLRADGWTDEQVARVVECNCPCHHDGNVCLC
jgi:hypothetical protein